MNLNNKWKLENWIMSLLFGYTAVRFLIMTYVLHTVLKMNIFASINYSCSYYYGYRSCNNELSDKLFMSGCASCFAVYFQTFTSLGCFENIKPNQWKNKQKTLFDFLDSFMSWRSIIIINLWRNNVRIVQCAGI